MTFTSLVENMGQQLHADKAKKIVPIESLVEGLVERQVRRKFFISVINKQTNAAKALVRLNLGWRYDEDEAEREATNKVATRIVSRAFAGKEQNEETEVASSLLLDLGTIADAIEPCDIMRKAVEKEMCGLARQLPVYEWAKGIKGLGEIGLAVIVAEAGNDLSLFPKKGHLWKRLGLAPYNGKAYSSWRSEKNGLSKEEWVNAGYSPRRRAEIYACVGEPLMKHQSARIDKETGEIEQEAGPYGVVYANRRVLTAQTHPDWTKMHSHMDAMRKMTKILLRDLWQEWRKD
jgi:hypothetical protein